MTPKTFELPARQGPKPETNPMMPHLQLSDNSGPDIYAALADWLFSLEHIEERPTQISIPSTRAAWILETQEHIRPGMHREFTHIHTEPGPGSQHLSLPQEAAAEVIAKGWGEPHPMNPHIPEFELLMIYAPRDDDELEVVKRITLQSYRFVTGAEG